MNVTVLIFGIAFLAGSAILILGWELSGRWAFLSSRAQRRLQEAETPELHEQAFDRLPAGSLGRKIAEAGWPLSVTQFRLGSLGLGLLAVLLCWKFFVPGLPALEPFDRDKLERFYVGLGRFVPDDVRNGFRSRLALLQGSR